MRPDGLIAGPAVSDSGWLVMVDLRLVGGRPPAARIRPPT